MSGGKGLSMPDEWLRGRGGGVFFVGLVQKENMI